MSKPSGQSTNTVQTNSTTGPPGWAQNAAQDIYVNSQNVADKLKPTSIAAPAGLTPGQSSLFGQLMGNVGSANGTYNGAIGTMNGLQGFKPPTINAGQLAGTDLKPYMNPYTQNVINAGQLAGTDLKPYMNPYTQNVIDTSLAQGKQALAQTQNQTADAASASGAFGGSRHGVQSGVNDAQYGVGAASLAANLNDQNFKQAQGAAATDIGTRMTADTQNAGNAISGAGVNLAAANGAVSGAGQQQQTYLNGLYAALMGQNQIQGQQQAQNQFGADTQNASNMLPYQALQIQQGALSGVPLAQTTNGTQTNTKQEQGNGLMQTLGGVVGLGSSLASMLGPAGFGLAGAGGLVSGLMRGGSGTRY